MEKHTPKKPGQPEIKEGKGSGPLTTGEAKTDQQAYPRKSEKDLQYDNQPEFTEQDKQTQEKR